jgi:hypothetical protein
MQVQLLNLALERKNSNIGRSPFMINLYYYYSLIKIKECIIKSFHNLLSSLQ